MSTASPKKYFYYTFVGLLLLLPLTGLGFMLASAPRLDDLQRKIELPSLYGGEAVKIPQEDAPVLISAFASWCVSCLAEHPLLMELHEKYKVPMTGIAWKDDPEKTKAWLEKHGNPYSAIGSDETGELTAVLEITGTPELMVIDPKGNILYRHVGPVTPEILKNMIAPILASR